MLNGGLIEKNKVESCIVDVNNKRRQTTIIAKNNKSLFSIGSADGMDVCDLFAKRIYFSSKIL